MTRPFIAVCFLLCISVSAALATDTPCNAASAAIGVGTNCSGTLKTNGLWMPGKNGIVDPTAYSSCLGAAMPPMYNYWLSYTVPTGIAFTTLPTCRFCAGNCNTYCGGFGFVYPLACIE